MFRVFSPIIRSFTAPWLSICLIMEICCFVLGYFYIDGLAGIGLRDLVYRYQGVWYYLNMCWCVCVFSSLPVPFHVVLVVVGISGCPVGLGCTFDFLYGVPVSCLVLCVCASLGVPGFRFLVVCSCGLDSGV
jgi:hypothetical protein